MTVFELSGWYWDDCIVIDISLETNNKKYLNTGKTQTGQLEIKSVKVWILRKEIIYLGHKISSDGIFPVPSKADVLQ